MYLHETMNKPRSSPPVVARLGQMNKVNRTLSGVVMGSKRIGNVYAKEKSKL